MGWGPMVAASGPAWLGLGGVVIGGVLGYVSSAVQESGRRRHEQQQAARHDEREDRIRFENRRFDAYVIVITAANNVYAAAKYPTVDRAEMTDRGLLPIVDPAFQMSQLNTAYDQFRSALSPAFLLATSSETRDCLAALADATRLLRHAALDATKASWDTVTQYERILTDVQPRFRAHRRAVRAAETAMRTEFGMSHLTPYERFDQEEGAGAGDDPGDLAEPAPARRPEP